MAENIFKYENVASNYENMKKILGDASSADSIAGILHNIDEDMKAHVDVVDMAIYGDLGKQMLLNWENTSSTFGSFLNNFDNWNKAVAVAAGNYAKFEQDVVAMRNANPLGMTSNGITDAYTNTGYYSSYDQDLIDTAAAYIGPFVAYNGLGYFDTGTVEFEKQRKLNAGLAFGFNLVADVLSFVGIGKFVNGAGGLAGIGTKVGSAFAAGSDDMILATGKAVAAIGDDGIIAVGRHAGQSFDDLLKGKTTQEMRTITQELVDDGVINNADDLARLFGGKASVAKTHLTSSVYNNYIKGFKTAAANAATAATPAATNTAATLSENAAKTSTSLMQTITEGTKNMSDDALAKLCGIPKQQLLDEAMLNGVTTREVALQYVKSSLSSTGHGVMNFVKHPIQSTRTYLETAKVGISQMGDDALAKLCGIPKQQLIDEAVLNGVTTKQLAFTYLKTAVAANNTAALSKLSAMGSTLGSTIKKVPGAVASGASAVGTGFGTYFANPGTKIIASSYVPSFIANNVLSDDAVANTTVTQSVYVQGIGTE